VSQLTQLRRSLGATTKYTVVKNTLSRIAIRDAGLQELEGLLEGPSAIAFVKGDAVEAAKSLRDFAKVNPLLVIKGGVLDGKLITAAEISKIADLESREVLLSKVAGAANAALAKAAALFQAPLAQTARLVEALRAQVAETTPAAAPAAPVDSAESTATDEVVGAEASTPDASTPDASATIADAPVAEAPTSEADVSTETPAAELPAETPAAEVPAEPTTEQTDAPADDAQV
jgi:large subunit ribosomal protein L10